MSQPSEPSRRHPNVINLAEVEPTERLTGSRFGFKARQLAARTGGRGVGGSHYEIPPGRAAFPFHFHCANEEAMYVLEGEGTLRLGDAEIPIRAGDWVTFPIGPEHPHQVINSGTAPLKLLALSTLINAEVVGYPDSKKIAAMGRRPGAAFDEPPWIRHITDGDAAVDYFKGEKLE